MVRTVRRYLYQEWRGGWENWVRTGVTGVMAGQAFRTILPHFEHFWAFGERSTVQTLTKGGVMLPEKSQGIVLQATVVAAGLGSKGKSGKI